LEHVVDRRLAALAPDEREVVELVACGEPLSVDVLEAVAPTGAITAAETARLLVVHDEHGVTRVRLVHPVFSECLQQRMPPLRARELRRRLAAALGARGPRDPDDLLRLADWALTSDIGVDPGLLVVAARHALDLVELGLAERLARAAAAAGGGWDAQQTLAESLRRQHRADEADEVIRSAEAASTTEAERSRSVVTRAENLYWSHARPDAADAVLARAAPDIADPQPEALQAMLRMFEGRVADALELAEALLARALPEDLRLWVLSTAAFSAYLAGRPRRAIELAQRGLTHAAEESGSAWKVPQFSWARCTARLWLGDLNGAAAEAEEGYAAAIAEEAGMRAGGFALVRGLVSRQQGRLGTATDQLRDATALLGDMDPYRMVSLALAELGVTLAQRGMVAEASTALDEADARRAGAMSAVGGIVALGRVWCGSWTGAGDAAAADALALADTAVALGNRTDAITAAHAAAVLGAPGPAADVLGGLAEEMEGPWAALYAAEAEGRATDDPARLLESADGYETLGAHGLAGAASAAAARLLRAANRNGAALLAADRARELLGRGDGLPPAALEPGELTVREGQVARLAAAGRSSREIADILAISVRTVDNHLGRAYQKLGVHARDALGDLLCGPG
jgi:DNA-binding CsgD family transcriptional regulator